MALVKTADGGDAFESPKFHIRQAKAAVFEIDKLSKDYFLVNKP